jgi:tripartite-type tricarboxylate transporter receptor subunit TctC
LPNYPEKPIKMIVGYAPGGAADNLIRPVADRISRILGQSIAMEYHPGAGGVIAADVLAKAQPDGYTLHITDSGPMTIVPKMKKTPYNPMTDFHSYFNDWDRRGNDCRTCEFPSNQCEILS